MRIRILTIKVLAPVCALGLAVAASAQNLVLNPNFTVGGSPSGDNWSYNAQGMYFYQENTLGANIASFGWNNGYGLWQNTTATIQPGASYALDVTAQVGQAPMTGLNLSFQDVTTGWALLDNANYTFASQSSGPGQWETFELDVPASLLAANVGDTIGVGIQMYENPSSQQGWVWMDSVSLAVVPEPSSLALLAMGGLGAVVVFRRRKE